MAKVLIGNFKGPKGDKGDKGDPGTAATIQVGTTQTLQPEENAEVTNTGTTTAAVLNFKIPRGEDGMTDLTAEYKDASEYTCQPTVNAPVVVKELDGKTEQGENPTPDNPQVIKGVGGMGYFDGILQQGYHNINGSVANSPGYVSNLNKIYCKENDIISIFIEDKNETDFAFLFFDNSGKYIQKIIEKTCTAPANSKYMYFRYKIENLTPQTAGYISVTVNGEYQTGAEVTGKNLAEVTLAPGTHAESGVTMNLRPDGSYTLNGTANNNYVFMLNQAQGTNYSELPVIFTMNKGKKYRISNCQLFGRNDSNPNGTTSGLGAMSNDVFYTPTEDTEIISIRAHVSDGTTYNSSKVYYPGIWEDESETDTEWQPFKRTSITIPLTSPLYEGDKICYVKPGESYVDADGTTVVADRMLYGVYRENAVVVFDGSEDETWVLEINNRYHIILNNSNNIYTENTAKCNFFKYNTNVYNDHGNEIGFIVSSIFFYCRFGSASKINSVSNLRAWLSNNPLTVVYKLATPYFEPFTDQSIFYNLRTDDTLSYVYSSDPIEPVLTVEVAKNSTGGYLLESYATAQKNAITEASNASRLSAVETEIVTLNNMRQELESVALVIMN